MRSNITLAVISTLLFAVNSHADGVAIEPGQWEMTSTMTMSLMPQPQTTTTTECIVDGILDPETFNKDEDSPCDIVNVTAEENTARWDIKCPVNNGAAMEGQWEVTSHGDTISGQGKMSAEIAGQQVGFDMTWKGKRLGECE